ncbi:diphthine synthase, partial [Haplosporangium bisporale]
ENRDIGLHTLVLLDIKVKEQSLENMARGRLIYEPPRFMTLMIAGTMAQLVDEDFGEPLHSLVIIGKRMHVMEAEMVRSFCPEKYQAKFDEVYKRDYE